MPSEIRFIMENFDIDNVAIKATDQDRQFQVKRADFAGTEERTIPGSTESYRTASTGTMYISLELVNMEGEQFSSGEFELDLREDWSWRVRLRAKSADHDPLSGCFGCLTYHAFAVNKDAIQDSGQSPDSLYVVVGGNFISDPVDY